MEFQLSGWQKQRIVAFCEITGEHRDDVITVTQSKNDDDLKCVVATTSTGDIISFFDITDPEDIASYIL